MELVSDPNSLMKTPVNGKDLKKVILIKALPRVDPERKLQFSSVAKTALEPILFLEINH